jgi:hypothetical protein
MVSEGLSPSRIRQSHVVLRLVFEAAVADGYLARNPALGTNLPRLGHQEAPYFATDVVDALSDAMEVPTTSSRPSSACAGCGGARRWR